MKKVLCEVCRAATEVWPMAQCPQCRFEMSLQPQTDADKLALAVLNGEEDAAFALADEVQRSWQSSGDYVTRQQLIDQVVQMADFMRALTIYAGANSRRDILNDASDIFKRLRTTGECPPGEGDNP